MSQIENAIDTTTIDREMTERIKEIIAHKETRIEVEGITVETATSLAILLRDHDIEMKIDPGIDHEDIIRTALDCTSSIYYLCLIVSSRPIARNEYFPYHQHISYGQYLDRSAQIIERNGHDKSP